MKQVSAGSIEWVFDPMPPSGRRSGGDPTSYVFSPDIDALVREVVQNANDQRVGDAAVQVEFNLRELSGSQKDDFLAAADWDRLGDHLLGVAQSDSLINGQVRDALLEVEQESLFILQIHDRGTKGLTGTEDGTGNFGALCKHVLVTNDEKAARGGSYGLGKSVLWRFSALSTVLFGSMYDDDADGRLTRLFGNTGLPFHEAEDGEWEGPGFFGIRREQAMGARADSVRAQSPPSVSNHLFTARPEEFDRGTTAVVVGFSEPAVEGRRPLPDIAKEIATAAAKWFWPRIEDGTLAVTANAFSGTDQIASVEATAELIEPGYLQAASLPVSAPRALLPGDVAEREIEIRVPRLKSDAASGDITGTVVLRLTRTADDKSGDSATALVRGAGMVVSYHRERRVPLQDGGFRAVLLAGTRHGNDESDQAIEEFLRASEPPAHDEWVHVTNALRSRYRNGSRTRLNELWEKIREALTEMLVVQSGGEEEGPARLAKYFQIGAKGTSGHEHKFLVDFDAPAFDGSMWQVKGRARRTRGDRKWFVDVSAKLEGEGGRYAMVLSDWSANSGTAHLQGESTLLRIDMEANQHTVEFKFGAAAGAAEAQLVTEARLRVDARTHQSEV